MKSRLYLFWIVIILCLCNIITIFYYSNITSNHTEQLTVMSNSALLQKQELENYRVQLSQYESEVESLKNEIVELQQENITLTVENIELEENAKALNTDKVLAEQLIRKYEALAKSSSITLKEKETYINELNNRLASLGGIDIFELPVRKKEYEEITIWLEDGAHESYADLAITYIRKLPRNFIDYLKENEWFFIITTRNIEDTYQSKTKNTIGLTIYSKKRIYVLNHDGYIASAVLHEFAHAMDCINGYISYSEEWMDIYNEEKNLSGFSEYFTEDPREYFAECVQQYYTFKDLVRKKTPKSYAFIQNLLLNYE